MNKINKRKKIETISYLKYSLIIIVLFLALFGSLILCYNIYNNGIDDDNYISRLDNIKCYSLDLSHNACDIERTYINGSQINVTLVQQI